jgi:hypothetical protein
MGAVEGVAEEDLIASQTLANSVRRAQDFSKARAYWAMSSGASPQNNRRKMWTAFTAALPGLDAGIF